MVLGRNIKREAQGKKITQNELAKRIGKKREYIALLEKGETDMQLSTFLSISDALGLQIKLTELL
ncbi:helix-turn-helix domain-containing protein [Limibacterium fermenti]|uniref:helix-turn-helix domain-containing protein n=1 Tax=Limibacterium fermenti TaxID=3229863 RepID=UPI003AB94253